MKKYEYDTVSINPWENKQGGFFPHSAEELNFLNKRGDDGWELTCMVRDQFTPHKILNIYYFKRELNR